MGKNDTKTMLFCLFLRAKDMQVFDF